MSDLGTRHAPEDTAGFLMAFPLLAGMSEAELEELARVLRRREVAAGTVVWRQGDEAKAMLLIAEGRISVSVNLPGGRSVEVTSLGPGEVLGEVPLMDGGRHSASVTALEPTTLLSLSRSGFAALVSRRHPTSFALKRGIATLACARLRRQLAGLAEWLGEVGEHAAPQSASTRELEYCGPPDSGYVRRLATFHAFDALALWGLMTAGRFARVPAGRTLIAEGTPSNGCFVTINGAVERVIVRGERRIRVGLAGPGQAFGYESLIDGGLAPVSACTRERTLVLVLPPEAFGRLFTGEDDGSHEFLDVIHRDLMAALRQALRPQARLAASL